MSAGGEATLFPMTLTGFLPFSSHRVLWSLTLLLSCIVPVAVHIARRRRIAELISKIPGPTAAHPILGNLDVLYELKKYRHLLAPHILLLQTMCGLAQIHDKDRIFRFWLGFRPVVSFFKAETVEVILSSNTVLDKSFDYTLLHPWLGTGLLTSSGNKWRRRRKMLTPAFHFRILEDFIPVFNEQAVIFVKNLKEQQNKKYIDIVPLVTLCTLDIICETAMGVKVDAQLNSNSHYVRSLYEVGETFMARVMRPWLWPNYVFYMSSFGRKFKDNLAQLHNFTRKVIRERKAELLEQKLLDGLTIGEPVIGQKRRQAFLDLLLSHHIQDSSLTEEDIREEVDTFMFEGHDTTAMGISWAMYLIGLYTDVQQKIHEELDAIFGEDRERAITPDDLKEMKYLECALKESQRLFPSVPFIGRELMEDVVVNGYTVPRGTTCFLFTFMLHRDKEIFPNPEVFDPDRFRPENCVGRHPFAYVPFSAGPRNCIGQKFALMEEKVVLCSVLRNFCIQSVDFRDKIHLVAELVTRSKHGLKIRLRPR
ncbi:cytochrome P450 4c3-like [Dermacentor albipictus]|uniref:cytochrome P450 4c3-like n=1 Tax=Dermacentor albipictus TaxID=60249 RepID=UPI0031FD29A7